jgi:hypothetical protein
MRNINMRRNVIVLTTAVLLAVSLGATSLSVASFEHATAQMSNNSSVMSSAGQNQSKMMMGTYGPNITGSVPLGPTIAKAIASKVNVTLANASTTAEKAVGANAHAVALRIGVVPGFLVYMALVVDMSIKKDLGMLTIVALLFAAVVIYGIPSCGNTFAKPIMLNSTG